MSKVSNLNQLFGTPSQQGSHSTFHLDVQNAKGTAIQAQIARYTYRYFRKGSGHSLDLQHLLAKQIAIWLAR